MLPRCQAIRQTILIAVLGLVVPPALSQVFDIAKERVQLAEMNCLWRFHTGDDLRWADPNFDDSGWSLISSDKSWSDQGFKGYSGLAWYRVKVVVPAGGNSLSLYIPSILTSYQVYADGKLIGGLGGMPPHEAPYQLVPSIFKLPNPPESVRTVFIAIRVWHWKRWASFIGGGLRGGIRIGETRTLSQWSETQDHEAAWNLVAWLLVLMIEALACLSALAFFALRPREKEYLWFGIMMALFLSSDAFGLYSNFHLLSVGENVLLTILIATLVELAKILFFSRLLGATRDWFFWSAIVSTAAPMLIAPALQTEIMSFAGANLLNAILGILPAFWTLAWFIRRTAQGVPEARILVVPTVVAELSRLIGFYSSAASVMSWNRGPLDFFENVWQWPFPFSIDNVSDALFLLAMLAVLVYRFTETRQHEERFANELDAARAVQQVLIPREIPTVPGFAIESVYKPAGQVGGDFFQIIPAKNGGVLVVIGDVSGKGMPAAMSVSLLVGTVRTLAHYTQSPGEILAAMNQRMLARSNGGFTTCLVVHVGSDGKLTIANAGHLSPYRDGVELPLANGLPLGLNATTYAESTYQLDESETLTLLTDGVVEARNKQGDLFGFERTATIAANSVEAIAKAAQDFGQEDDITVLTLTRVAVDKPSIAQVSTSSISPSLA